MQKEILCDICGSPMVPEERDCEFRLGFDTYHTKATVMVCPKCSFEKLATCDVRFYMDDVKTDDEPVSAGNAAGKTQTGEKRNNAGNGSGQPRTASPGGNADTEGQEAKPRYNRQNTKQDRTSNDNSGAPSSAGRNGSGNVQPAKNGGTAQQNGQAKAQTARDASAQNTPYRTQPQTQDPAHQTERQTTQQQASRQTPQGQQTERGQSTNGQTERHDSGKTAGGQQTTALQARDRHNDASNQAKTGNTSGKTASGNAMKNTRADNNMAAYMELKNNLARLEERRNREAEMGRNGQAETTQNISTEGAAQTEHKDNVSPDTGHDKKKEDIKNKNTENAGMDKKNPSPAGAKDSIKENPQTRDEKDRPVKESDAGRKEKAQQDTDDAAPSAETEDRPDTEGRQETPGAKEDGRTENGRPEDAVAGGGDENERQDAQGTRETGEDRQPQDEQPADKPADIDIPEDDDGQEEENVTAEKALIPAETASGTGRKKNKRPKFFAPSGSEWTVSDEWIDWMLENRSGFSGLYKHLFSNKRQQLRYLDKYEPSYRAINNNVLYDTDNSDLFYTEVKKAGQNEYCKVYYYKTKNDRFFTVTVQPNHKDDFSIKEMKDIKRLLMYEPDIYLRVIPDAMDTVSNLKIPDDDTDDENEVKDVFRKKERNIKDTDDYYNGQRQDGEQPGSYNNPAIPSDRKPIT